MAFMNSSRCELSRRKLFVISVLAFVFCNFSGCGQSVRALDPLERNAQESQVRALLAIANKALSSASKDDLEDARAALQLAREIKSDDARVLDGWGCYELRAGNTNDATKYFQEAIKLSPGYDGPYAHLAEVAVKKRDPKSAREIYKIALEVNPMNYQTRNNYAILLYEAGEREKAKEEIRKAYINSLGREETINRNYLLIARKQPEIER